MMTPMDDEGGMFDDEHPLDSQTFPNFSHWLRSTGPNDPSTVPAIASSSSPSASAYPTHGYDAAAYHSDTDSTSGASLTSGNSTTRKNSRNVTFEPYRDHSDHTDDECEEDTVSLGYSSKNQRARHNGASFRQNVSSNKNRGNSNTTTNNNKKKTFKESWNNGLGHSHGSVV